MNQIAYGKEITEIFLEKGLNSYHKAKNPVLHRKTKKIKEKQYICWSLNRYPLSKDAKRLLNFFLEKGFVFINENVRRIQWRKFLENNTSIHISSWKKHYGFNIDIHIDVRPHEKVKFSNTTLRILSELYIYLKKTYGRVFMLPLQRLEYQGYVSQFLPQQRVHQKKNRSKCRLR